MYLLTASLVLAPVALIAEAIMNRAISEPGVFALLLVTAAMCLVGGVIFWLGYVGNQRVAYVAENAIVFRTWVRFGPFGRERRISLTNVRAVLLLRPHHIEFTIPDATTRVGTLGTPLHGVDRLGTFWWRPEDYLALQQALGKRGIPNAYRHVPGIGTLLSTY